MRTKFNGIKQLAVVELAMFIGITIILKEIFDLWFWRYAGPVSLVVTLGLLAAYLRRDTEAWSLIGLRRLRGSRDWWLLIPQVALAFAALFFAIAVVSYGGAMLGWSFMDEMPAGVEARWGDVEGNLPLYLVWILISWLIAGFIEEVIFRGFVISRLLSLFGGSKLAAILAVALSALLFGGLHFYNQGLRGSITAGAIGIAFGTLYLLYKRNLWPLIFVHASINSIGFTVRYLGLEA